MVEYLYCDYFFINLHSDTRVSGFLGFLNTKYLIISGQISEVSKNIW